MPYKARTLSGAQRRVRQLERIIGDYESIVYRMKLERIALAKLAATGRTFFNPGEATAAENIRDGILKRECNMRPDGSPY